MNNNLKLVSFFIASLLLVSPCMAEDAKQGAALLSAVQVQDTLKVKELLSKGADANAVESDRPLIVWAAQNSNVEIVRALIEAKANVNATDPSFKETALHRAIDNQHAEVVAELLKAKADPNAKDIRGESCLAKAVKGEKAEIVAALVTAGADVNYQSEDGDSLILMATQAAHTTSPEIIRILGKAKANPNQANIVYSPLYYASELGNKELVQALLDAGANPNAKSPSGRTALYAAIKNSEIVELLLNAKADPNLASDGVSPTLIAALENGTDDAIKALIKGGADVNTADDHGNSALKVAQNYSKTEIAELLKKAGAIE